MAFVSCKYGIAKAKNAYANTKYVDAKAFWIVAIAFGHYVITHELFVFPFMEIHTHKASFAKPQKVVTLMQNDFVKTHKLVASAGNDNV